MHSVTAQRHVFVTCYITIARSALCWIIDSRMVLHWSTHTVHTVYECVGKAVELKRNITANTQTMLNNPLPYLALLNLTFMPQHLRRPTAHTAALACCKLILISSCKTAGYSNASRITDQWDMINSMLGSYVYHNNIFLFSLSLSRKIRAS